MPTRDTTTSYSAIIVLDGWNMSLECKKTGTKSSALGTGTEAKTCAQHGETPL